jgi:uncharacterized glyoxalase superfamily protein PhnB
MSQLANLHRQAEQVLRWHRERHWPIATQLRDTLPSCRGLDDREIFERDFELAEAREYVARRAGFESWEQLEAGADALPSALPRAGTAQLLDAQPCVLVSDIPAACEHYRRRLGFETAFRYGEPPYYAEVFRDGVRLALRHADPEDRLPSRERRKQEELLSATILVDDPEPLYRELVAAGASFHQALRMQPWGKRSFIVEDEDGNLVAFSEA